MYVGSHHLVTLLQSKLEMILKLSSQIELIGVHLLEFLIIGFDREKSPHLRLHD